MRLLQRTDGDIRAEGASTVERRRRPACDKDGGKAPNLLPRRSKIAAVTFDLPGGSFAFVMATGIVSIAAMRLGHDAIGTVLFALNLIAFPLLCVLMLIRLCRHPVAVLGELRSHRTGAGFLTAVAATITTLAGAHLASLAGAHRLTASLAQFIEAATLLFWAIA